MIARTPVLALAALVGVGLTSAPADAQRRQRLIEIFGDDRCPESSNDEIVVCAKKPESDRYRIPTELREGSTPGDREAADARVDEMVYVGRTGTQSCSPVGPGGFTGCHEQLAREWREEKRQRARAAAKDPR